MFRVTSAVVAVGWMEAVKKNKAYICMQVGFGKIVSLQSRKPRNWIDTVF